MTWLCDERSLYRAGGVPAALNKQSGGSHLFCLFWGNGETMGSPAEGWPVFAASVFISHQMFTQNTPAPLRTRSVSPLIASGQRHSVPQ